MKRTVRYETPLDGHQEAVIAIGDAKDRERHGERLDPAELGRLMARLRMSYLRLKRWVRKSNNVHNHANTGSQD
jgi:hypothetical protein